MSALLELSPTDMLALLCAVLVCLVVILARRAYRMGKLLDAAYVEMRDLHNGGYIRGRLFAVWEKGYMALRSRVARKYKYKGEKALEDFWNWKK
jgi:hypothetical protein